jgi:hypothetical protein
MPVVAVVVRALQVCLRPVELVAGALVVGKATARMASMV